ncbi:MAG: ATP-binding protein [Pseudonocardiaceae bacterium]
MLRSILRFIIVGGWSWCTRGGCSRCALRRNCTEVGLILERGPHGLRVAVRDASPVGFPGPVQRSTDPLGQVRGRELELVESLTTASGVDVQPDGNTVWAEMTR